MPGPACRAILAALCAVSLGAPSELGAKPPKATAPTGRQAFILAPLPPPRPASLKLPEAPRTDKAAPAQPAAAQNPTGPSACIAIFAARGGLALPAGADAGSGACAIAEPVTFRKLVMPDGRTIELDSAVTVACSFALALLDWAREDLPDIVARENGKLAGLTGVGGHACRPRNGTPGAPISEHATGNALDLNGLRLEGGRIIRLTEAGAATRPLREALKASVCARFRTVLGPGADSAHKDHLHLDMRLRPRDYRICQWQLD